MPMSTHLLDRGIALWKEGHKEQARKIFETIVQNDMFNDNAWLWYVYSLDTKEEKIAALEEFLVLFPKHALGKKALAALKSGGARQIEMPPGLNSQPEETEAVRILKPLPRGDARPRQRIIRIATPWVIVGLVVCLIFSGATIFSSNYRSLRSRVKTLEAEKASLTSTNNQLNQNYQALVAEKSSLANSYSELNSRYVALGSGYSTLKGNYDSLYSEYTQLSQRYNTLVGNNTNPNNIAIEPLYILVYDRKVDTTFYDTNGQLITLSTPFSSLESAIENGTNLRRRINEENWLTVTVYTSYNDPLLIRDFSDFITPNTFSSVVTTLYRNSSNSYDFIYRMWYMVGQLASYSNNDLKTPHYAMETLLAGGGDSEDLAILFASLIRSAPVNWRVELVYIDTDSINNPQTPDHVAVYISSGQGTYIVDPTNNRELQPYHNGVTGWLGSDLQSTNGRIYPTQLR
jgi:cell division protein FtsL